jgi:hypothetical protein
LAKLKTELYETPEQKIEREKKELETVQNSSLNIEQSEKLYEEQEKYKKRH